MCFKDIEIAERFVEIMSELSLLYMDDKRRFGMQFLAEIMKRMSELNIISVSDLYNLSEEEIINKIRNSENYNISECFKLWQNATDIKTSNEKIIDKYCINIKAKKRYINISNNREDKYFESE